MESMFSGAISFNQDISPWNTSNVSNMRDMFTFTQAFNQPIGSWDTSNVFNMDFMFELATAFNQDLTSWNVVNIPSEPPFFADNSALAQSNYPVWGTAGS